MIMKFNADDFSNLDAKNMGNWPIPVKAVAILFACALALGAGYYFDTQDQITRLETVQRKEGELIKEYTDTQWKAATLPRLKEQLVTIEKSLTDLQRRLPNQAEVAGLIQDISQAAIATGLKSELFRPGTQLQENNYYILPIALRLSGDYHAFGKFVSQVASMPRIVTQHDITIKSVTAKGPLTMELVARIYFFPDADSAAAIDTKAKPKPPKK
ncbi:type 4a pilus biogenesis protein PilO [Beggiatoa leptomitoformis]|uniref:Type 4a pilus biogenesis protein PilO n=1 Tax=Beggiatoa leptomitoformis TaxID=288004 RepID=A0A2N9YH92_9GAMM|nr:type 4a pilus biogenesis protein PilO [Beggiatoa leptomitoformis]ALG67955.2 type 4a pilus biogenesis protein PilO [Beggiatoa leptomitoformis]AUI69769.2 type 4a pilus biogenesis protein PilO [Beggiatoa leptomitoformis]